MQQDKTPMLCIGDEHTSFSASFTISIKCFTANEIAHVEGQKSSSTADEALKSDWTIIFRTVAKMQFYFLFWSEMNLNI